MIGRDLPATPSKLFLIVFSETIRRKLDRVIVRQRVRDTIEDCRNGQKPNYVAEPIDGDI